MERDRGQQHWLRQHQRSHGGPHLCEWQPGSEAVGHGPGSQAGATATSAAASLQATASGATDGGGHTIGSRVERETGRGEEKEGEGEGVMGPAGEVAGALVAGLHRLGFGFQGVEDAVVVEHDLWCVDFRREGAVKGVVKALFGESSKEEEDEEEGEAAVEGDGQRGGMDADMRAAKARQKAARREERERVQSLREEAICSAALRGSAVALLLGWQRERVIEVQGGTEQRQGGTEQRQGATEECEHTPVGLSRQQLQRLLALTAALLTPSTAATSSGTAPVLRAQPPERQHRASAFDGCQLSWLSFAPQPCHVSVALALLKEGLEGGWRGAAPAGGTEGKGDGSVVAAEHERDGEGGYRKSVGSETAASRRESDGAERGGGEWGRGGEVAVVRALCGVVCSRGMDGRLRREGFEAMKRVMREGMGDEERWQAVEELVREMQDQGEAAMVRRNREIFKAC